MIGLPLGILYSNAWEWVVHKYLLHGLGRSKKSFWSFHFHEHHREVRKRGMYDPGYERPIWGMNAQTREAASLVLSAAVHLPLARRFPWFTAGVLLSQANYWRVHRRSHLDPEWAREHLPWHVDHHLGDQDANWCVTFPFTDWVMGTRRPGSPKPASYAPRRERSKAERPVDTAASAP